MSEAIILNENLEKSSTIPMPKSYADINPHNLYLYTKAYLAAIRANSASTKTRSEVRDGGKKPWGQKGRGSARAGSRRSPLWVGGGVIFGPSSDRNYFQKVNKKQKKLALLYALNQKAASGALFVVDNIAVESGKTKDAAKIVEKLNVRDVLIIKELIDEKTFLAFRNLSNCYLVEPNEINAYVVATYRAVIIEKSVFETLVREG